MAIIPTKDNLLKQQRDMINFILSKDESDEIKMSTCVEIKDTLNQMFRNWTDTFLENTIFTVDSKVLAVEAEEKNFTENRGEHWV